MGTGRGWDGAWGGVRLGREQGVGVGAKVKGWRGRKVGLEGQAKWEPLRGIDAPESLFSACVS